MKNVILSVVVASFAIPAVGFAQSMRIPDFPNVGQPTNARPGVCYAVRLRKAEYVPGQRTIEASEAFTEKTAIQADFAPDRVARVETTPAHTVYDVIHTQLVPYNVALETKPAHVVLTAPPVSERQVPYTYNIREPRFVWRRGANLSSVSRVDQATGDVWCLVLDAGVTGTAQRTVRMQVGPVTPTPVPARITNVTHYRVIPGSSTPRPVEAAYTPVIYNDLISPAREGTRHFPATPQTVGVEILKDDEKYELVEVACETVASGNVRSSGTHSTTRSNMTTPGHTVRLTSVQEALRAKGLYNGPIDGLMGPLTTQALVRFQRQNGITRGPLLSIETLRRLGF